MLKAKAQTFNDGLAVFYRVENVAPPGGMPVETLVKKASLRYKERTVGIQRYYTAMQNHVQVDHFIRILRSIDISSQDVAILPDGKQYIVRQVQCPEDVDPPVLDITLERLAQNYDVE